jgi:hypothetical protein
MKHLGRRSKKAQKRVEKMKKAYKESKEEKASSQVTTSLTSSEFSFVIIDSFQNCLEGFFFFCTRKYKFKGETLLAYYI